jgi:hypothetical protein
MALKKRRLAGRVLGVGRNAARLERAVELGAIDAWSTSIESCIGEADLVYVSTPVGKELPFIRDIASLVNGGLGVHCCSNTDWTFVMDLNPAVISLDAYATATEFLLYAERAAAYLERGGVVAWGVVPADARLFAEESEASLVARMTAIRNLMTEYVSPALLVRQSLITPSCGIKFANEEEADRIQRMAAAIARAWRGAV